MILLMDNKRSITNLNFLHVTDCHLSSKTDYKAIDIKLVGADVRQPLRDDTLDETLGAVANELLKCGTKLDAIVFSGDGTLKGDPGGQTSLRGMLLKHFNKLGIDAGKIVATPGNHDVVSGTLPSSPDRYSLFQAAWMAGEDSIVPFLDGIHDLDKLDFNKHVLVGPDRKWAVFPINSSNWSQIRLSATQNDDVKTLQDFLSTQNDSASLTKALERLTSFDLARISQNQLSAIKRLASDTEDIPLRIATLHHHLLPVSEREEFKAGADLTNLGALRQVLLEHGFHIVVHGHKHHATAHFDHIYPTSGDVGIVSPHRLLTVSGGTFGPMDTDQDTPVRLISIANIPNAPICHIRNYKIATPGQKLKSNELKPIQLWENDPASKGPISIYGDSVDEVYARSIQSIAKYPGRPIACTVKFESVDTCSFPIAYPYSGTSDERNEWFAETVKWWQQPTSRMDSRIPYIHGSRLKRFGGNIDQIERIIRLLKSNTEPTSRTIALVVDPGRDFGPETSFASFCFVQFCLRQNSELDCIGYYRAQEFNHWWPVNIAELRYLQAEILAETQLKPGKITTITPYPRLSDDIRQPTKVAVPIIDQWVDSHPVRIAQIALYLANQTSASNDDGIKYWRRCLNDLKQATAGFHKDGNPVAIEGLQLLEQWLTAACGPAQTIEALQELRRNNEGFNSPQTRAKFDIWEARNAQWLKKLQATLPTNEQSDSTSPSLA
jgi:hypothetical protein